MQRWRLDAPGKSVSGTCDRVARRAVEGEQAETFSHIRMGDVDSRGDPRIAERRRQGRHVAHDVEDLGSVELCRFALGFGCRLGEWHPPAREPEVHRCAADTEKRRRTIASLGVDPVAAGAILHEQGAAQFKLARDSRAVLACETGRGDSVRGSVRGGTATSSAEQEHTNETRRDEEREAQEGSAPKGVGRGHESRNRALNSPIQTKSTKCQ